MRREQIPIHTLDVVWRDERRGRATLTTAAEWQALLDHYGLPDAPLTDDTLVVETATYRVTLAAADDDAECERPLASQRRSVTIERLPQTAVQAFAWTYAEETRMARIDCVDGALGVHFLDEDAFVPFSQLRLTADGRFDIVPAPAVAPTEGADPNEC